MEDKIKFRRTFGSKGESQGVNIPPELIVYLDLNNGEKVVMMPETGKHGKYISLWKNQEE